MERSYIVLMCIVEIHEMDIISIRKTMTIKQKQVFVVALKRTVLSGSTKIYCKTFLNFWYEEEVAVSLQVSNFNWL